MTCSDFLKELTDYLDGAMDAQTQAELEDHLQWCHNCYVVCNTTKMTIEIYRDSHLYELPEDLARPSTDRHPIEVPECKDRLCGNACPAAFVA